MTSTEIIETLTKAKRKFDICEDWRSAILYCKGCGVKLGKFDLIYNSHKAHEYCSKCVESYIKPTPYKVTDTITVLEDSGFSVLLRYEDIRREEYKQCYFTKKGRFINVHGVRIYI